MFRLFSLFALALTLATAGESQAGIFGRRSSGCSGGSCANGSCGAGGCSSGQCASCANGQCGQGSSCTCAPGACSNGGKCRQGECGMNACGLQSRAIPLATFNTLTGWFVGPETAATGDLGYWEKGVLKKRYFGKTHTVSEYDGKTYLEAKPHVGARPVPMTFEQSCPNGQCPAPQAKAIITSTVVTQTVTTVEAEAVLVRHRRLFHRHGCAGC